MHWELQDLINEILQAGLNENSWKHGCGKELCSVISKCVHNFKHISSYFAVWQVQWFPSDGQRNLTSTEFKMAFLVLTGTPEAYLHKKWILSIYIDAGG